MKDKDIKICFIAILLGYLAMTGVILILGQRIGQVLNWHLELENEVRILREEAKRRSVR